MKKIVILLFCIFLCGCAKNENKQVVNVLNWSSYIPNEILTDFTNETGIKVNYNTYSSNEELLAKISSSKNGTYDLIFPSDYMVELMKNKGMLEEIDKSKLENYPNINEVFLNQPYDKYNTYSLPFLAATTVIAYDKSAIKENISGYKYLLNSKYKNNIVLIDDQRIIIGMGLLANNYDMNETNNEKLQKAKDWLIKLKPNIKAYDSDSPKTFLITDETDIAFLWNAEATIAKRNNKNIEIIYAKEGHAISVDNYAIVKDAKNINNAYKFIDYLLRTDVNKRITDEYPYINTTYGAMNMSEEEINDIINKGTYVKNIGKSILKYDKIWAEIK